MHAAPWTWNPERPLPEPLPLAHDAGLVLVFGPTALIEQPALCDALRGAYPHAVVVGASTGGDIVDTRVQDGALVVTPLAFDDTVVRVAVQPVEADGDSEAVGQALAAQLPHEVGGAPLAHVLVLADGLLLNGSAFVRGMESYLPRAVGVTGGLAADGDRFERTPLWADGLLGGPAAVAVGFYGRRLRIGYGAVGGWEPFGPDRLITRSEGNVLHELDDQSALDLYKRYLGPYAERLPASGLLFPLGLRTPDGRHDLVRSTLGVDEAAGSITFAGDVPQGTYARFMKTNHDRLIDGALAAARAAGDTLPGGGPAFALLISCIGRRWVLQQRIEEEVEGTAAVLGAAALSGFYSYGEIAPAHFGDVGALHNQTMTVTTFAEA